MTMTATSLNLLGLDRKQLEEQVAQWGNRPFRARQLLRWMHQRGETDFDQMTDLARSFRAQLDQRAEVGVPVPSELQQSSDGTLKWLFDVGNNNAVEAVCIPEEARGTFCISSLAGCTVAYRFGAPGPSG